MRIFALRGNEIRYGTRERRFRSMRRKQDLDFARVSRKTALKKRTLSSGNSFSCKHQDIDIERRARAAKKFLKDARTRITHARDGTRRSNAPRRVLFCVSCLSSVSPRSLLASLLSSSFFLSFLVSSPRVDIAVT